MDADVTAAGPSPGDRTPDGRPSGDPGLGGPSPDLPRVAVLGAGRMGTAMAQRLRDTGFEVAVYNRTAERARAVAGRISAVVLESPAATAAWARHAGPGVLLVSLADDDACRQVYLGPDGLLGALVPGTVVADTSTIDPDTARELAAAVAGRGSDLLDSPVSGSIPAALSGSLTVMVGGDPAAFDRARPVLDAIGRRVVHVGGSGSGAVVKLAVNAVVHALNEALSEAIVLAEHAGVARSVFYDVVADSAAAAPFVGYKRDAFEHPESAPVAFSLDLVAKDLRLILALADRVGAPMTQTRAVESVAAEAIAHGFGAADMSAVARFLREHPTGRGSQDAE